MINLTTLNLDNKINSSYLKSSYSNGNCPYIKGKKYESIFGNNKIVAMDSHLNKYYISQIKKQDKINQEKKLLELIEKLDNKKAFKVLKEDYLKEKFKSSKGYYLKQKDIKKDYFSNLINLENYREKLLNENIATNSNGDFLSSLMIFLGNRPKKVVINKKNKKIELLSQFKSFSQRKKELKKLKKPKKRNSLQLLINLDNLRSPISTNEKYFNYNYYNVTTPSSIMNNNYYNNNNNSSIKKNLLLNDFSDNYTKNNNNNPFIETQTNNFPLNHFHNVYTPKSNLKLKIDNDFNNHNFEKKLSFNNLKIAEISKEHSFDASISDSNLIKMDDKLNLSPIKAINSMKTNNFLNKLQSGKTLKLKLSAKKNYLPKDKDYNKKNEENKIMKMKNINNRNKNSMKTYNKTESNFYKHDKIKNHFFNISDDEENLEEVKMIDLKIINEKLYKQHRKIMKKFLKKIRIEEKNIKESSNMLSSSLNLFKKIYKKKLNDIINKTEVNTNKRCNTERLENKKRKNYPMINKDIQLGNYDFVGKSKYRLPKVNNAIFGSLENNKDQFEILQFNLQNEVLKQIEKRGFPRKIKLNGRDILDKLKIKAQKKF